MDMEILISLDTVPPFYQTYVKHVHTMSLKEALGYSLTTFEQIVNSIPESKGGYRYAEGKWTIKELLVHVFDTGEQDTARKSKATNKNARISDQISLLQNRTMVKLMSGDNIAKSLDTYFRVIGGAASFQHFYCEAIEQIIC